MSRINTWFSLHTDRHTQSRAMQCIVLSDDMYENTFCPCVFLRSSDSDDTTKRKVNLVFEKIQTLKSRATGSVQGDNKVSRSYVEVIGLWTRQGYELLITGCPLTEPFTSPPVFTQPALRSWLMFKHVHAEWERVQMFWVATRCQNPNLCFLPRNMILHFFLLNTTILTWKLINQYKIK